MSRYEVSNSKQVSEINSLFGVYFPSLGTYSFSLNGLTIGNFILPPFNVSLGTITLG